MLFDEPPKSHSPHLLIRRLVAFLATVLLVPLIHGGVAGAEATAAAPLEEVAASLGVAATSNAPIVEDAELHVIAAEAQKHLLDQWNSYRETPVIAPRTDPQLEAFRSPEVALAVGPEMTAFLSSGNYDGFAQEFLTAFSASHRVATLDALAAASVAASTTPQCALAVSYAAWRGYVFFTNPTAENSIEFVFAAALAAAVCSEPPPPPAPPPRRGDSGGPSIQSRADGVKGSEC